MHAGTMHVADELELHSAILNDRFQVGKSGER